MREFPTRSQSSRKEDQTSMLLRSPHPEYGSTDVTMPPTMFRSAVGRQVRRTCTGRIDIQCAVALFWMIKSVLFT